jgi:hypothetical protein
VFRRLIQLFVLIMIVSPPGTARAADTFALTSSTPNYLLSFADDHKWTVEFLGTTLGDVSNRHVVMGGATAGVGYYFFNNLAIQMDFTGYGFNEGRVSGEAIGWTLGLRHHLLKLGSASIFVDVSGGLIEASHEIPYGGTHFNDTFEVGPGIALPLKDNMYFLGGVRYFHLSNGNRSGPDRNPSVNAIQGVVGVMFRF